MMNFLSLVFLKGNDIGCLTVMIDRSQVRDIAMPSQRHEDYITWLNILKQGGKAYSLPKELAYYQPVFIWPTILYVV